MPGPVFGHIPGYPVGSRFESRAELSESGVHRHRQAGISGSASEGADSIVLSGGYEDDLDNGDEIVYTGHGGRDQETNKQIADQNFSRWNRALAYSSFERPSGSCRKGCRSQLTVFSQHWVPLRRTVSSGRLLARYGEIWLSYLALQTGRASRPA